MVGAEVTGQADPRMEYSRTIRAGDGGSCWPGPWRCLFWPSCVVLLQTPWWTAALHSHLSCASAYHESGLIPNALREAFRLFLNRYFGASRTRFPSCSSVRQRVVPWGVDGLAYELQVPPSRVVTACAWCRCWAGHLG